MDNLIMKKRVNKFLSYYKPYHKIFTLDMFFAGVSSVTVLLFPLISGYITKEALSEWTGDTQKKLFTAGLLMFVLLAVRVISNITYAYFGHAMGAKMESAMREELFEHYGKMSFRFHAHNNVGKLVTVMANDLTGMTELFHHGPEDLLMTFIKFVGAFVILLNINLPLTLIVFLVLPVLCVVAVRTDKVMEKGLIKAKTDLSEMNGQLEDALSGIRTVKAFGNEAFEAERFLGCSRSYTESKCAFYKVEAYFYEVVEAYPQFLTMLTVFFGALFIGQGTLDIPVLITFLLYVGSLAEPVRIMTNFMKLYEEGKAGFIRFMEMLEISPEVKDRKDAIELGAAKGEIEFCNVFFQYDDSSETVLENISIQVRSGESAAFVGASGIGKTTISMLLARFYDVTEGSITIDGIDVRDISESSLRQNIGIVQQEVYIFNGSIKDNISYGNHEASDAQIFEAAKLADACEFIEKLEQGYDTIVGTRGITLSGGQRQRISLARVFLKNPPILILDEATSALDYESETLIQSALARLMKNRTCIVIAHRLSTIKDVDKIIVLANKKIAQSGTHNELMQCGGEYARIYKMY